MCNQLQNKTISISDRIKKGILPHTMTSLTPVLLYVNKTRQIMLATTWCNIVTL